MVALLFAIPSAPLRAQQGSMNTSDTTLFRYVLDIPTRYINDHCLIKREERWHLFYTDGSVGRKWMRPGNEARIGHAVSFDLLHWTVLDPVLHTGPPDALDHAHLYAPYVFEDDGTYYMYYSGNKRDFTAGEYMLAATSTDLFTWTKVETGPVLLPNPAWAFYHPEIMQEIREGPVSGRDPHLLRDPKYGYILYYASELRGTTENGFNDREAACIAASTSPDLKNWTDRGPVLVRRVERLETNRHAQPESPCVVRRDGRYYLFWKGEGGTYSAVSDDPFNFENGSARLLATSHAGEIIEADGRWFITSCSRALNDLMHTWSDRSRGLYLAEIVWEGIDPVVRPLTRPPVEAKDTLTVSSSPDSPSVLLGHTLWVDLPSGRSSTEQVAVLDTEGMERTRVTPVVDNASPARIGIPTTALAPGTFVLNLEPEAEGIRFTVQ